MRLILAATLVAATQGAKTRRPLTAYELVQEAEQNVEHPVFTQPSDSLEDFPDSEEHASHLDGASIQPLLDKLDDLTKVSSVRQEGEQAVTSEEDTWSRAAALLEEPAKAKSTETVQAKSQSSTDPMKENALKQVREELIAPMFDLNDEDIKQQMSPDRLEEDLKSLDTDLAKAPALTAAHQVEKKVFSDPESTHPPTTVPAEPDTTEVPDETTGAPEIIALHRELISDREESPPSASTSETALMKEEDPRRMKLREAIADILESVEEPLSTKFKPAVVEKQTAQQFSEHSEKKAATLDAIETTSDKATEQVVSLPLVKPEFEDEVKGPNTAQSLLLPPATTNLKEVNPQKEQKPIEHRVPEPRLSEAVVPKLIPSVKVKLEATPEAVTIALVEPQFDDELKSKNTAPVAKEAVISAVTRQETTKQSATPGASNVQAQNAAKVVSTKPVVEAKPQSVVPTKPVVEAKPQSVVSTKPVVEAKLQPAVSTKPVVEAKPQSVVSTKPAVVAKPQSVVSTKPAVVAKPQSVVSTEPVVEAKPQSVVSTKPAVEAKPQSVVSSKPVMEAKPQAAVPSKKTVETVTTPVAVALNKDIQKPIIAAESKAVEELPRKRGDEKCPCIGFDNVQGKTMVLWKGKFVEYPGDLGGTCRAWDAGVSPDCKGSKQPDWCQASWCYVDPRKCDIDVLPQITSYLPTARYQNMPLFYSYQTCGSTVTYSPQETKAQEKELGVAGCRCVGISHLPGHVKYNLGKDKNGAQSTALFPAEAGSSCKAWDLDNNPLCKGTGSKPAFCEQKWCFVDPCSCDLSKVSQAPKASLYLQNSTIRGAAVFYSYETCGSTDSYTTEYNTEACTVKDTQQDCEKKSRCAWNGKQCLGKEFVDTAICTASKEGNLGLLKRSGSVSASSSIAIFLLSFFVHRFKAA